MKTTNDHLEDHLEQLKRFIDQHYVKEDQDVVLMQSCISFDDEIGLNDIKPFSSYLFETMDKLDIDDVTLYKKAHLDRKLFSKIRSNKTYQPSKKTVFKLMLALELQYKDAKEFLEYAGFSFSRTSKFDLVVKYAVQHDIFNVFDVNELLEEFTQDTL